MVNLTIIEGRLTADPTLTQTDNSRYCRFTIACDRPKHKDKVTEPDFFKCVAFEATAEVMTRWLNKGDKITVVGRLKNEQFEKGGEKRTSTTVIVREVHFGNNKKKSDNSKENGGIQSIDPAEFEEIFSGEDLPF